MVRFRGVPAMPQRGPSKRNLGNQTLESALPGFIFCTADRKGPVRCRKSKAQAPQFPSSGAQISRFQACASLPLPPSHPPFTFFSSPVTSSPDHETNHRPDSITRPLQMHTSNNTHEPSLLFLCKYQMRVHRHHRFPRDEFADSRCDPEARRGAR